MRSTDRRLVAALGLVFLLSLAWAAFYHMAVEVHPFDDAFITFRYADRLASGEGLTYNDGEKVFGSSSPLYILWLSGLRRILPAVPTPSLAVRGNLLFFLLSALAMAGVAAVLSGRIEAGLAAGIVFALHPPMQSLSGGGMETFLFVFLLLGAVWGCATGRWLAAATFAGLSPLARPEGILAMAAVGAAWWISRRPRSAAFLILLLAPAIVWTLFATAYFGNPIPHSIRAKMAPLYALPPGYSFLTILVWMGRWTLPAGLAEPAPARDVAAFLLAEAGSLGLLLSPAIRRQGGGLVAILFQAFVAFYALTNPMLFDWYTANFFVFWLPALVVGLPALGRRLASGPLRLARPEQALAALVGVVLAGSLIVPYGMDLRAGRSAFETARTPTRLRTLGYRDAALWLNEAAPRAATVATAETGAFGYYWHGRMLDACALVSPQALHFLPVPQAERPDFRTTPLSLELIQFSRPEYVATLEVFARKSLLDKEWFMRSYRSIGQFPLPVPVWGSPAVLLYQRADLAPPASPRSGLPRGTGSP